MQDRENREKIPPIILVVVFVLVLLVILPRDGEGVTTVKPAIKDGVFATALGSHLYFHLSLSAYDDLEMSVSAKGKTIKAPVPSSGAPFVIKAQEESSSYSWKLTYSGQELLSGSVAKGLAPYKTFNARGWLRELLSTHSCPPIWVGNKLVAINEAGLVLCYELQRQKSLVESSEGNESLRLAWLFMPPQLAGTWARRRHELGGLVALPNGYVLFFYKIDGDTLGVCALDVEKRSQRWPSSALPKERHLLPKWMLDKKHEWNQASKGEFISRYQGLPIVTPKGRGVYEKGRVFVQLSKGRRAGFLCYDPKMMRINWNVYFAAEDLEKTPLHEESGAWLTTKPCGGARDFTFVGTARMAGGRLYGVVDTGTYGGINKRQLAVVSCRPCVISRKTSAASIGRAVDGKCCFRLAVSEEYCPLNTPIEMSRSGGLFRIGRGNELYEWPAASSLPRVRKRPKLKRDFIDLLLVGSYEFGRTRETIYVSHPQSGRSGSFAVPQIDEPKSIAIGPEALVALSETKGGHIYLIPLELLLARGL